MNQMHLGLFIYPAGHHIAGWRHPAVDPGSIAGIDYYRRAAQTAERGKFDLFFVGDMLAAREKDGRVIREGGLNNIDSISITSALSAVTECLGLVATLSTTYNEPYYIAERFASLDHISNGRSGWNFGQKSHMEKTLRYERAKEFVDICKSLWDGKSIDHRGRFFSVRAKLKLPRLPQRWPVMFQAGGSPAGTEFAAMVAEAIFAAQSRLDEARTYRNAVIERMPRYGRSPDTLAILPGLSPIVASTEQEAKRKEAELDELILPAVGVWMLSEQMQFRLYDYALDAPLPSEDIRASGQAFTPRVVSLMDRADRDHLTVRECANLVAKSRSHGTFVGTVEGLVDHMLHWQEAGGCDGFNIMPAWFPDELDVFVDQVVPVLQRRGLFRTEYTGTTLRSHLGLQ
jgi:alkanesulfonate monooxygenase SsuD/methylene tetrahydromethanopterin reductase-like flavin-dependent oxidoreductase (luciferase family)